MLNLFPYDIRKLIFDKVHLEENSAIKIQRFYRKNTPYKKVGMRVMDENIFWFKSEKERKYMITRLYIRCYPDKYIFEYPEFLALKIRRPDLLNWIKYNIPENPKERTRRHIKKFLSIDDLSSEEILYAGW